MKVKVLHLCPIRRRDVPAHGETRESNMDMEPEGKGGAVGISFADVNTYSKPGKIYEM